VKITDGGEKLGRWIEANPIVILTIAALFTVASVHFAESITMESDTETYVDENSRLYVEFDHLFNDRFGSDSIVVMVEGDAAASSESMEAMDRLTRQMETVENVLGTTSIAEMVMEAEAKETGVRRVPESQARIDGILEELEKTNPAMLNAMHDLLILYGTEAGQRDMQAVETLRRSLWNGLNHIVSQRVPDRRTAVQAVAGLGGGARVGQGPQAAFASFTATLFEAVLEEENV